MRIARLIATIVTIAAPSVVCAQAPTAIPTTSRFDAGFVVGGEWQQATGLPFDRDALPSASFDISWRRGGWSYQAGWMRVARDLSTVQGGTLSVGRLVHWGPVNLIPALSILAGETYASRDSTGYDFIDAQGVPGHVPRYSYSDGFSFGGGLGVTVEYAVYRMIGIRASASQWLFGGSPLEDDRPRTIVGVGLSVRVMR